MRNDVMYGCCGAPDKERCTRPPCPCNMSAYSSDELREIEEMRRIARAAGRAAVKRYGEALKRLGDE